MTNWSDLRKRCEQDHEQYRSLAETVANRLEERCRGAGLLLRVEHRAKEARSTMQKLIMYPNLSYEELQDKAGVRLIPCRSADVVPVVEAVKTCFDVKSCEDKSERLRTDSFGYGGWHVVITVPGSGDAKDADLMCEVQVRTEAQHLWATASHELAYKGSQATRDSLNRPLARVAALLEIVDMELDRVRTQNEEVSLAEKVGQVIQAAHWRLGGAESHQGITLMAVESLLPVFESGSHSLDDLETFISENEQILKKKVDDYSDETLELVLSQPESIFVFFLVQTDVDVLREKWPSTLPARWLEAVESAWPAP